MSRRYALVVVGVTPSELTIAAVHSMKELVMHPIRPRVSSPFGSKSVRQQAQRRRRARRFEQLESRHLLAGFTPINQVFWGGPLDQAGNGLTTDGTDLYVAGSSDTGAGLNGSEGFVNRYDANLNLQWSKTWPSQPNYDVFQDVAVTTEGVYTFGGSYSRTNDFAGGKESKGITVKFPLSGPPGGGFDGATWDVPTPPTPAFGYNGTEELQGRTTVTELGQPYTYSTGVGQNGFSNGGRTFLSKLDASGNHLWTWTDGSEQVVNAYSTGHDVVGLNGNLYVAGRNDDDGTMRPMLRKLDSNGNLLWTRKGFGSFGYSGEYWGISALNNAIYAVGYQSSGVGGTQDFLIEKWDENGIQLWSRTYDNGLSTDQLRDVTVTGNSILAVGQTTDSFGGFDAILMELATSDGSLRAQTQFGGVSNDSAHGVVVIGTDVYVAGATASFFGGGNLLGQNDLFVAKYLADFGSTISLSGADLLIQDTDGGTSADQMTLSTDGTSIFISDPNEFLYTSIPGATGSGTHTVAVPIATFSGKILVDLLGGDDQLTINLGTGNFSRPIEYRGGETNETSGDRLVLTGGAVFNTVTYTMSNVTGGDLENGTIQVTGNSLFTFTGLEPVTDNLAAVNRVFDFTGGSETITISDDAFPANNVSQIASTLSEFVTFVNPSASLTVRGGSGADVIDLQGLDGSILSSVVVTLDGDDVVNSDNSADTLQVRSLPTGVALTLLGGLGSDQFWLFNGVNPSSSSNTVDGIRGTVSVSPTGTDDIPAIGDTDQLIIVDRADVSSDTITVTSTTVDGVFDSGSGVDITWSPNQIDQLDMVAGGAADTIIVSFSGLGGTDLDAVTLQGAGGADRFQLLNQTPAGVVFTLDGDESVSGAPNTGSNQDLLDLASLSSPRTVSLTAQGTLDGFQGTETALQGPGSGFTNIDAVRGPSGGSDTLIMNISTHRTHWDVGGQISGYGPFGATAFTLVNSLADSGVLVSDDATLSETGNNSTIGQPTGADPIVATGSEQDLAWSSFENLVGAASADDRFDLRNGASLSGTLDGRGQGTQGDSLDYRDWTTSVVVNLGTPNQASRSATNIFSVISGVGADLGSSIENAFGGLGNDTITGDEDHNILGDGHGSDTLDGGAVGGVSGNDLFRLEPGQLENGTGTSADVIADLNGQDTLDFRFADSRVQFDIDLLNQAQDVFFAVAGTQTVTLQRRVEHPPLGVSMFENLVGSQFNDILDMDPLTVSGNSPSQLPPTSRSIDGNSPPGSSLGGGPADPIPPGDEWHLDAGGQAIWDTGFSIQVAGSGTISYQSIESVKTFNMRPRIIDDGDDAFIQDVTQAVGSISLWENWNQRTLASSYGQDFRYNHANTQSGIPGGIHTATWRFDGLTPGLYRVAISFPDPALSPDLGAVASDAEFSLFDDGRLIGRVDVDQRTAAMSFQEAGVMWNDLGVFPMLSHSMQVQLRDRADGIVLADAVRIERVNRTPEGASSLISPSSGGELTVLEGSSLLSDGVSELAWVTPITQAVEKTFVIRNDGDGTLRLDDIAIFPLASLPTTNYTLAKPPGLSPATPISLLPGQSTFFTLTLDATTANGQGDFPIEVRIFSNDYDENIVQVTGATGISDPTDLVNVPPRDVDPFTFQVRGVVANEWVIDDGDPQFSTVGVWTASSGGSGYLLDSFYTPGDGSGERGIWKFTGLPDGVYRVSTTWQRQPTLVASSSAPFTVSNASGLLYTTTVNQTIDPAGFLSQGATWQDLGPTVNLTGGEITVQLLDTANQPANYVIADAVRIERLFSDTGTVPPYVTTSPDIRLEDGGTEIVDDTGVIDFGTIYPSGVVTKTLNIRNVGGSALIVQQPIRVPQGYELISFDGVSPPDGVTAATIAPGGSTTMTLRLAAGLPSVVQGELAMATNDPDENPLNVQLRTTIRSSRLIDNQDGSPLFTNTAGFVLFTGGEQGYQARVHVATGDSSGDSATWTFAGVTSGQLYRVSASWTPDPNRATNAPYTVAGVTAPATINVNQRVAPTQRAVNGHLFHDLGIFTANGTGVITVTLTDNANGFVIADVVRLEPIVQPELEVSQGGTLLGDGTGQVDFGSTTVGIPVDRVLTIANRGNRALQLGTPQLPTGFVVVGAFPNQVAAGSSVAVTVRFLAPATGEFGGLFQFASDNQQANPFEVLLQADAYSTTTMVIDDGGPGYVGTAPFGTLAGGFLGDYQQAAVSPPAVAGTATWTFTVAPLTQYRISATWLAGTTLATNATYQLTGASVGPMNIVQNQRLAPNDFNESGANWEDLAIITTDGSGTLIVTLSNSSGGLTGPVNADAIRVERLMIINNEDPAPHYATTGYFLTYGDQGRRGTIQSAANNAPASTANFTFSPLVPGTMYRVSATWSTDPNRATNSLFTVSGGVGGPESVRVNQELPPDDYVAEGSSWEDLGGPYTVDAGGQLIITLSNATANEYVIADAVRLQPLSAQPEMRLEDSGANEIVDGGSYSFGSTAVGTAVDRTFTVRNLGAAVLTLDSAALTASLQQTPQFQLISNYSTTTVAGGGTATFTIRMLAGQPGSPAATIPLGTNDLDENPYELTLMGDVVVPSVVIDDGDAGYSEPGGTATAPYTGQGYNNDVKQIAPGSTSIARYTFTGLTPGATYELAATWTTDLNRSLAAPLQVQNVLGGNVDFSINQQVAPGDFTLNGRPFKTIGSFRTTGTSLVVQWSAATSGNVIADAVRLVQSFAVSPEIQVTGSPDLADGSTVNLGTAMQGGSLSKTFTITNQGSANLVLSSTINLPAGYTLGAVSPAGLFGGTTTTLTPGAAPATFQVLVNTTTIGTVSGLLEFGSNDTDENPFSLQLTATVNAAKTVIDDGDPPGPPGYSDTGFNPWGGQGYQGDVRESTANAGRTATWTFTGLNPAGIYRVAATWTSYFNRATNAPYTVTGSGITTVAVNQRVAPASFTDLGVNWQYLGGSFTPSLTNTITVVLSDTGANGNVIADAVRLEQIFGPEIDVMLGTTAVIDGTSNLDLGRILVNGTLNRTFQVNNIGAAPLTLGTVTVPSGFTLVTPPASPVAASGTTTFVIGLTSTIAPGTFSGTVSFNNNDADESPFNFQIQATVVAAQVIDDGEPGFSSSSGFALYTGQGYLNDVRAEFSPNGGDTATWTFTGLPAQLYRVSTTWSPYFNRATQAQFSIQSTAGGGSAGPVPVNQRLAPSNAAATGIGSPVFFSGVWFSDLATVYNHTGGDLIVTLSDTAANGWIIADAVRIAASGMLQVKPREAEPVQELLTKEMLKPVLDQAIRYWTTQDATAASQLQSVDVILTDLPRHILGLGEFSTPTIWLDDNAAGYGWQIAPHAGQMSDRIDLLSVIAHELGHVLGHADLDSAVHSQALMVGSFLPGERRIGDGLLATELSSAGLRPDRTDASRDLVGTAPWMPDRDNRSSVFGLERSPSPIGDQFAIRWTDSSRSLNSLSPPSLFATRRSMVAADILFNSESRVERTENGLPSDELVRVDIDSTAISRSIFDRYRNERQAAGRVARDRDELFADWEAELTSDMAFQSIHDGFAASRGDQRAARRQALSHLSARLNTNGESERQVDAARQELPQATQERRARDGKQLERKGDQPSRDAFYASLGEEPCEARTDEAN
jgi:hypothetical protein